MDPSVQVALVGTLGIFITACSVVAVAIVNGRKEKSDTADNAMEKTLRERLTLRDEQIKDHLDDKTRLKDQLAQAALLHDEDVETITAQGLLIAEQVETIAQQAKLLEEGKP
jgi:hypothetical protein